MERKGGNMTDNQQITIDLAGLREDGIFLMVPAYAGQCFAAFARSMMQLSALCAVHAIPMDVFFIYNESLITRARNYCVDEFLRRQFVHQKPDGTKELRHYQHGMFIDTDIEFNAIDVLVLAHLQRQNADFDIVCGPYPRKVIPYEKLKEAVDKGYADEDPNNLENFIGDYVFNSVGEKPITIGRPSEVLESGTGFMMFTRQCILDVAEANPQTKYLPDHRRTENFDGTRHIHALFDTYIDPESKRYLSEDYFFCQTARKAGKKVWLIPWVALKHHGFFIYSGSLPHLAQAGMSATVDMSKIKKKK